MDIIVTTPANVLAQARVILAANGVPAKYQAAQLDEAQQLAADWEAAQLLDLTDIADQRSAEVTALFRVWNTTAWGRRCEPYSDADRAWAQSSAGIIDHQQGRQQAAGAWAGPKVL